MALEILTECSHNEETINMSGSHQAHSLGPPLKQHNVPVSELKQVFFF